MTTESEQDAIAFLEGQHDQARRLLSGLASGAQDRSDAFQALVRLLAVHETAEEMVVYPMVRAKVPDGDELADARLSEENEAKQLLADLEKLGVEDPGFESALAGFADALNEHAAQEEQQIFPSLRQHIDPEALRRMRAALATAEAIAPTHPHPHGPESALGNMVVGPFVAIADRVRDALRAVSH